MRHSGEWEAYFIPWQVSLHVVSYLIMCFSVCQNEYAALGARCSARPPHELRIHRNVLMPKYMRSRANDSWISLSIHVSGGIPNEIL